MGAQLPRGSVAAGKGAWTEVGCRTALPAGWGGAGHADRSAFQRRVRFWLQMCFSIPPGPPLSLWGQEVLGLIRSQDHR